MVSETGYRGDDAIHFSSGGFYDAFYEVRRDETSGTVVYQDDSVVVLPTKLQAAAGGERSGLAGFGASGVFLDAGLQYEL